MAVMNNIEKAALKFAKGNTDYLDQVSSEDQYSVDMGTGMVEYYDCGEDDNPEISLGEFVGGVAFALVDQGRLHKSQATPALVSQIVFEVGKRAGHADLGRLDG